MRLIERFLWAVSGYRPCRIIAGEHGEPYLERYYLIGVGGWHAYLHRFVGSDPDRGLHDHPWGRALSLVLSGGYDEIRFADRARPDDGTITRFIRPGSFNQLRCRDYHRVVLRRGRPAWTLFVHGRRVKGWGFRRRDRYVAMAAHADDFRHRDWWKHAPTRRALGARAAGVSPSPTGAAAARRR